MVAAMMTSQQALSGSKVFAAPRAQTSARRGIVAVRAGKYDEELIQTASHMTAPGKGLLAIDESNATAGKRLDSIGGEWTAAASSPSILFGAADLLCMVPGRRCHALLASWLRLTWFACTSQWRTPRRTAAHTGPFS